MSKGKPKAPKRVNTIRKSDQKFKIYIPVERGLSMLDLVAVCKDAELQGTAASSLHPMQSGDYGLAVTRPEICPITTQNVWKFHLNGLSNLWTWWPYIRDDWHEKEFQEQFIKSMKPDEDLTKGIGKGLYRRMDFADDEAEHMRRCFSDQRKYRGYMGKRHNCWVMQVHIYPDDCPRDVVNCVKGAFENAGYGKS